MKPILNICLSILFSLQIFSQTYFDGGIYENTTWTAENSPYILTGHVVLFPEKTLTIQPGVSVIFSDDYYLEVRGKLLANGTVLDSIVFTTENIPNLEYEYLGIQLLVPDASIVCEYCKFDNLMNPVMIQGFDDNGSNDTILNCSFTNNIFAISGNGNSSGQVLIDNCVFANNYHALSNVRNFNIANTLFFQNIFSMYEGTDYLIDNCVFHGDSIGISHYRWGSIQNSTFIFEEIAIVIEYGDIEFQNNEIKECQIGIRIEELAAGTSYWIKSNEICSNNIYNIEHLDNINVDLTNNCWCEIDSTMIEEKIYDGYDNISSGLVNYDVFDESCENILKSVIKVTIGIEEEPISPSKLCIYPNPSKGLFFIELQKVPSNIFNLQIFDVFGNQVYYGILNKESIQRINLSECASGLYIVKISSHTQIMSDFLILE